MVSWQAHNLSFPFDSGSATINNMNHYKSMSYDKKKNRIEERVYSVTMTECELRLFSEFLEQRGFGGQDIDYPKRDYNKKYGVKRPADPIPTFNKDESSSQELGSPNKRVSERLAEIERNEAMEAVNTVLNHKKEDIPSLQDHNRMSKKWISEKDPYLQKLANPEGKGVVDQIKDTTTLGQEGLKISGMLANENKLHRIGYDNKYSAKGLERILGKKIDADEAENIVRNRLVLADKYDKNSSGYIHKSEEGILDDVGRRWDDAKMVYGEALDGRSLGKDAAIAAGGLAAAGLAVHSIRKHKKKKQAQKEALNNKFRASGE